MSTSPHSTVAATQGIARRAKASSIRIRVVQALMVGPLGLLVVGASIYFSAVHPSRSMDAIDWTVAAWAVALGLANVYVGSQLASPGGRAKRMATRLLVANIAFSIVKLIGYQESASVTFVALDALALAFLHARTPRHR
jgi:hypothetical protein